MRNMKRFMAKSILFLLTLLIGVFIGMNKANEGLLEMKGYSQTSFEKPLKIVKTTEGEIETSVLGNEMPSFQLKERQEKLEEASSFNFFSEVGNFLASIVTTFFQTIIEFIYYLFE